MGGEGSWRVEDWRLIGCVAGQGGDQDITGGEEDAGGGGTSSKDDGQPAPRPAPACRPCAVGLQCSSWRHGSPRCGENSVDESVINIEYKGSIHGIENLASEQNRPWSLC